MPPADRFRRVARPVARQGGAVSATARSSVCQAGDGRRERRAGPSRPHLLAALAISLVAVAMSPAAALAATTITEASIDGVQGASAPGGSVLGASVTADVSSGTWRATRVNGVTFGTGNDTCAGHSDQDAGDDRRVTFNVTAPGDPGSYNVGFTPNSADDCTGTAGDTFTLTNGLRVTQPATNPNLPPRCGINVMLVLDKSGSIQQSGQT